GSTLAELAIRRESERPLSPGSYDPSVPEELSAAVLRALESDVADRYASAREFALGLRGGLAGEATAATRALGAPPTDATRVLADEPARPVTPQAPPRRPAPRPVVTPTAPPRGRSTMSRLARAL